MEEGSRHGLGLGHHERIDPRDRGFCAERASSFRHLGDGAGEESQVSGACIGPPKDQNRVSAGTRSGSRRTRANRILWTPARGPPAAAASQGFEPRTRSSNGHPPSGATRVRMRQCARQDGSMAALHFLPIGRIDAAQTSLGPEPMVFWTLAIALTVLACCALTTRQRAVRQRGRAVTAAIRSGAPPPAAEESRPISPRGRLGRSPRGSRRRAELAREVLRSAAGRRSPPMRAVRARGSSHCRWAP